MQKPKLPEIRPGRMAPQIINVVQELGKATFHGVKGVAIPREETGLRNRAGCGKGAARGPG